MAAPLNCCNPCATVETVNIPGVEGTAGTDGADGVNAFTQLTADLVIPVQGANVTAFVSSALWMVIGQVVIIGEGVIPSNAPNGWANFQVASIASATEVTLTFLEYDGDTATGQTLATGATVSPAGLVGPAGP
jgi:hypothetical protein